MVEVAERLRAKATAELNSNRRAALGQFMTPGPVARLMAGMVRMDRDHVRILEPGAGMGSLIAAVVAELCSRERRPEKISIYAYELDQGLLEHLVKMLEHSRSICETAGVEFQADVVEGDFIEKAVELLMDETGLFGGGACSQFDLVITNPPYAKLNSDSRHRKLLRRVGIETSNLYSAFVALSVKLLADGGEMVAITPRSFCNGAYFRPFREFLLSKVAIRRVHIFESRTAAFQEDSVLQENIIVQAVRGAAPAGVRITLGDGSREFVSAERIVCFDQLVHPGDPQLFIHIVPEKAGDDIAATMRGLDATIVDLGLKISTGRVVDFRAKAQLRQDPGRGTVPLLYPTHFAGGEVNWPKNGKKPNALFIDDHTRGQVVPDGNYVLVKRFSSKEERRRIVATVYVKGSLPAELGLGIENKLNYFHAGGLGMDLDLARGLALFLNSTLVDTFFRQFSGHTQVNATDLRMMTYPTKEQLHHLGAVVGAAALSQEEVDTLIQTSLLNGQAPETFAHG